MGVFFLGRVVKQMAFSSHSSHEERAFPEFHLKLYGGQNTANFLLLSMGTCFADLELHGPLRFL